MSSIPDDPVTLPNGHLACRAHRLEICATCTVDYTYKRETDNEEDSTQHGSNSELPYSEILNQLFNTSKRVELEYEEDGTMIIPHTSIFEPPTSSETTPPIQLFPCKQIPNKNAWRFVYSHDPKVFLIYADGFCLNNGKTNASAGWGFHFRFTRSNGPKHGRVCGRLEGHGPSGEPGAQTVNRAELRAVIGALFFKPWYKEGWKKLVVATDSEYVVMGATTRVHK